MKTFAALSAMILCTVVANLFMKTGADTLGSQASPSVHMLSWRLVLGLAFFACAALLYIFVLGRLPLNVAQSFAAAQFIAVIIASWLVLSEPMGVAQWIGVTLIAAGIIVVGWGYQQP